MTPDEDAAIRAVDDLTKSVTDFRQDISTLRRYGQRSRRLIWALVALSVVVVALIVVVWIVAAQASRASERATDATSLANRNRQTQVITCEAGNEARAANITLWNYVLELASQNNPTPSPQQTQRLERFKAYLKQVYAPRDCDSLTPAPSPKPPPPLVTPSK